MVEYIERKRVKAKPMNRLDYNKYRGWDLPNDENGDDKGYLVEYLDSDKGNHPDHTGYISWCPKKQFELANSISETFTDRLLNETRGRASDINKLNTFMKGDVFPTLKRKDKKLLYRQQRILSKLVETLGRRLERANTKFTHDK